MHCSCGCEVKVNFAAFLSSLIALAGTLCVGTSVRYRVPKLFPHSVITRVGVPKPKKCHN